jgi:hypothetical protein
MRIPVGVPNKLALSRKPNFSKTASVIYLALELPGGFRKKGPTRGKTGL